MLQRWIKSVALLTLTGILLTGCRKSEFSEDEPLPETFSPLVYTTSQNNFLYALDPITGVKQWELILPERLECEPVVIGDFLYLAAGSLYKVDAKRGELINKYEAISPGFGSFATTPYADGNILYIGTTADSFFAFDIVNENIKWRFGTDGACTAPTLFDGQVYVATNEGSVYAIDKMAGSQTWKYDSGPNQFISAPTIGRTLGGKASIYLGGTDGRLYVLDATTGVKKWEYVTGAAITSSPIAYGGNVVFGSYDYYVYCIDTVAKTERWKFKTEDRVLASPFGDNNIIYAGSLDYTLYAINIIDGTERWKYKTGALIKSSPLVHEGVVYVGSFDKNLYAFDTSGHLRWQHNINGLIESSPVLWDLNKAYYPAPAGMSLH